MITENGYARIKLFFRVNVLKSVSSNSRSIFNFSMEAIIDTFAWKNKGWLLIFLIK